MDLNCPNIKLELSHVANYHHRTSNDWSTADVGFDYIDMKNSHTTPPTTTSSTSNNVDILDYSNCVPVTPNSLDSSNGLNGSCSAMNLNGTNGHHHQQQQSIHTFEVNDHPLHPQQQQQLAYLSSSSSQSVTPIDMEDQDRIKLERKRLRNRLAASKCRKRKIEKINKLEEKVKQVRSENNELQLTIQKYREQLITIKKELTQHAEHGCSIPLPLPYPT